MLDVRAPSEFAHGRMPGSTNLPILDDDERMQVGTAYKQEGHESAMALGHRLVSGPRRQHRIDEWIEQCRSHPETQVMCWRGGERSRLAQQWLAEAGFQQQRVEGGFKALRQACLYVLDHPEKNWWVVSGRTGSAKTTLIERLPNAIDLEGRANHRGSAFGSRFTPQPTPVSFENQLATDYLQHEFLDLVVEDESRTIGRMGLPLAWHACMQQAQIALVEVDIEERIAHIESESVTAATAEAVSLGLSSEAVCQRYLNAATRIRRRLGGLRMDQLCGRIKAAFANQASHESWISYLLSEYYDPMYDFQLARKKDRIVYRGNHQEVMGFLAAQRQPLPRQQ